MSWNEDWPTQAACREDHPDALFVQGAAQQQAKVVCFRCPVRAERLAHALDTRTQFGVWGGMTERERRQVLRNHPDVVSWRGLFETAMAKQEAQTQPRPTLPSQARPVEPPTPVPAARSSRLTA